MPHNAQHYDETLYDAPQHYKDAHALAPESSDLIFLPGSAAVILIGGIPTVAIENLSIAVQTSRSPIFVCGSISALAFDAGGVTVNVSGQIVQLGGEEGMSLDNSSFYPQNETDMIANINRVFKIDIFMLDHTKPPEDIDTDPILSVLNCQNSSQNININPTSHIRDSFTCVGTFMNRNLKSALKEFNSIPST